MRLAFLLISLMMVSAKLLAQPENVDQNDPYEWSAKVEQASGLGWYVMAEPLREYTVIKEFPLNVRTEPVQTVHIKQLYNVMKYRGTRLKKYHPKADALVSPQGEKLKLIRYTDDVERHSRIGNVETVAGKQIYLWSEPLKVNEPAFRVPFSKALKAQRDYLEKGLEKVVAHAQKLSEEKGKTFDALVFHKDYIQAVKYYEPGS